MGVPEASWVHYGLTSSDVVDTALALQLTRALGILGTDARTFVRTLGFRARDLIDVPVAGRTHGQFAEPTTFGAKFALVCLQAERDRVRLARARDTIAVGKLSGAVGTYSALEPTIEAEVCTALGLAPVPGHPGAREGPSRRGPLRVRVDHGHDRGVRDRGAPARAERRGRGRRALRRGPEGLVVDAAQAQPRARRAALRARPRGARLRHRGARGRRAVARAGHLAQLGRAHRPAGRDPAHRVLPAPGDRARRRPRDPR